MQYNDKKLIAYLSKHTKVSWKEISLFYLDFRQNYTIHNYFCVVKPYAEDGRRVGDMTGYYVPNDRRYCAWPRDFYNAYFGNPKAPYRAVGVEFEIDLEKGMPGFVVYKVGVFRQVRALIKVEVDLIGKVKFIDKSNPNLTGGLIHILKNAKLIKQISFDLFDSLDVSLNMDNKHFSLSSKLLTKNFGISNIVLTSPNTFSVDYNVRPIKAHIGSWEVSGELGYKVKGTIMSDDDGELAKKYPVELFSDKHTPVNKEGFFQRAGAVVVIILVALSNAAAEAAPALLFLP